MSGVFQSDTNLVNISVPTPSVTNVSSGKLTIADILLQNGKINAQLAQEIKSKQIQTGQDQLTLFEATSGVNIKDVYLAQAKLLNVDFIDLEQTPISPDALNVLPREVAEKFKVFPISINKEENTLNLAMINPIDLNAIEFIETKTKLRVKPFSAVPKTLEEALISKYSSSLAKEVSEALADVGGEGKQQTNINIPGGQFIREERVAEVVSSILDFAVKARASDVHIEPLEAITRVRYRIDGILEEKLTIPRQLHMALVSRVKIMSGMKIDERRIPQDGRFNFKTSTKEVDLRVSSLPTTWGEKIVIRLLEKGGGVPDLPELGLRGRALKNLEEAILRPHGIIIICGPTGSGKTTTLYSIIQRINKPKINILTLEDPIEYRIQGVNQVQVNPGAGLTFASGLRSFLRQDPNVILVGEIRDKETADLAIQASLTGHLVFSTLHTNDASGTLPRLLDMGAEPFLLASSMSAIVGQRVVRKIHEDCKKQLVPTAEELREIKNALGSFYPNDKEPMLYRGEGDEACNSSGYYGRMGIFEVLPVTDRVGSLILERSPAQKIEEIAVSEGMITMKQDGYLKALEGTTSLEEVIRVAQE